MGPRNAEHCETFGCRIRWNSLLTLVQDGSVVTSLRVCDAHVLKGLEILDAMKRRIGSNAALVCFTQRLI